LDRDMGSISQSANSARLIEKEEEKRSSTATTQLNS
jgi:hypothetical protein